jgi:hypothetical protein
MLPMPVKYTKMHYSSSKKEEMKLTGHGIQSFYLPNWLDAISYDRNCQLPRILTNCEWRWWKPYLKSMDLKKEEWSSREVSYWCSHLFPCGSPLSSERPFVWQHNLRLNWPIFFVVDIIIARYAILYNTTI